VGVGAPAEVYLMALESGRLILGLCDWRDIGQVHFRARLSQR
jgi:hypothetical protein